MNIQQLSYTFAIKKKIKKAFFRDMLYTRLVELALDRYTHTGATRTSNKQFLQRSNAPCEQPFVLRLRPKDHARGALVDCSGSKCAQFVLLSGKRYVFALVGLYRVSQMDVGPSMEPHNLVS